MQFSKINQLLPISVLKFSYADIITRDKTNLDIFWLKDKSLADLDSLPDPDELALEIVEDVEAALDGFRGIVGALNKELL